MAAAAELEARAEADRRRAEAEQTAVQKQRRQQKQKPSRGRSPDALARAEAEQRATAEALAESEAEQRAVAEEATAEAERQRDLARVRELAALAMASLGEDADYSILVALESVRLSREAGEEPAPATIDAVRAAVLNSRAAYRLDGGDLASFNHDGSLLLTGFFGAAAVWDTATGDLVATIRSGIEPVVDARFSPIADNVIALAGGTSTEIWDIDTDQLVAAFPQGGRWISFSADGSLLSTRGDETDELVVWDVGSGTEIYRTTGHETLGGFSGDGTLVSMIDWVTGRYAIVDPLTGDELWTLDDPEALLGVPIVDPGGLRVAVASHRAGGAVDTGEVQVWDIATSALVTTLAMPSAHDIAWGPAGRFVGRLRGGNTTVLFDTAGGRDLLSLSSDVGPLLGVAYSPSGDRVATASADGTTVVWDVSRTGSREVAAYATRYGRWAWPRSETTTALRWSRPATSSRSARRLSSTSPPARS